MRSQENNATIQKWLRDLTAQEILKSCQAQSQCQPCWHSNWNVAQNDRARWHEGESVAWWGDDNLKMMRFKMSRMKKIIAVMLKELLRWIWEKQNHTWSMEKVISSLNVIDILYHYTCWTNGNIHYCLINIMPCIILTSNCMKTCTKTVHL